MRERLLELINGFAGVRVLAVADLVADEYLYGRIARVSREAPVLILDYDETRIVPGGGGNAVNNIAALGGVPVLVGVVGRDPAGRSLLKELRRAKVDVSGVWKEPDYRTPTKTRILAGGVHDAKQQVVRIDRRTRLEPGEGLRRHIDESIKAGLPQADVVMVSDYDYGLVTPSLGNAIARRAAALRKPAVLDSRFSILSYSGFTSATPNEPEVEAALGITIGHDQAGLERAGRKLLRKMRAASLLVTRGKDGMALFEPRRKTRHVPIFGTDAAADVTGAGDTVISAYALALGAGASFYEAARIANYAGGLVVMKRGTATVSRDELAEAVRSDEEL